MALWTIGGVASYRNEWFYYAMVAIVVWLDVFETHNYWKDVHREATLKIERFMDGQR